MPEPESPSSSEELSFDTAQFDDSSKPEFACSACSNAIRDTYFRAADAVYCSSCRWAAEADAGKPKPGGPRRFSKAFLYGLGGAAAGTLVYFLVLWTTGYEVGLLSILVGWLVGKAVFAGSEQTGGRKYQVMAVALTYCSICASYAPLIVQEMLEDGEATEASAPLESSPRAAVAAPDGQETPPPSSEGVARAQSAIEMDSEEAAEMNPLLGGAIAVAVILAISLAAPFLAGFENIIGLLIIAFGLFEAWKHAAARELAFDGPFSVGE